MKPYTDVGLHFVIDKNKYFGYVSGYTMDRKHATEMMLNVFAQHHLANGLTLVKSRMMGDPSYKGTIDCFVKTLKNDEPFAFYKGFIANFGVHEAIALDDKLPSQNTSANEALALDDKLLSQNNSANVSLGLDVNLLSQNNSAHEAPGLDVKLISQNNSASEALGLDGKLLSQNNSVNAAPGLDSRLLAQNNSTNEALRLDEKLTSQDNSANQDIDEVRKKVAELLSTSVS